MSHLDHPRLSFAGRFFTNPSTINNKLANYHPDVRLIPLAGDGHSATSVLEEYAGFQYINPYGLANFLLAGCGVAGGGELVSGAPYAKLIDLDPDQQSISQIYGLSLQLRLADGSGFRGVMSATALQDLWHHRVPSAKGDRRAAGTFQSLIPIDTIAWVDGDMIEPLRNACETGVSIRFMTDSYQADRHAPDFNYGRIVGTLGPGLAGEPVRFPAVRRLRSLHPSFGPGYWKLDPERRIATIDLVNAMPLQAPAGEAIDVGPLHPAIRTGEGLRFIAGPPIDYSTAAMERSGGLVDLSLSAAESRALEEHPLVLHAGAEVLAEDQSMMWVHCDPTWLRLSPGETADVTFHARRAGRPARSFTIELALTAEETNNRPRSGIEFPGAIVTNDDGVAIATVRAHAPRPLPPRRTVIESQVYYVGGPWQLAGDLTRQSGRGALSVLVFDDFGDVEAPNWVDHVEPVFSFYSRLYPAMAMVLGFDSLDAIRRNSAFFRHAIALPYEHPLHFPPSRDLAPRKARMIARWIEQGMR